jgi:class 3 adenylate cyclase
LAFNLGDIIVEGDDIHGDGVNIAARLEGIAEPGGICISEDAYRQVHGKLKAPLWTPVSKEWVLRRSLRLPNGRRQWEALDGSS